jgi:hypothetical protein
MYAEGIFVIVWFKQEILHCVLTERRLCPELKERPQRGATHSAPSIPMQLYSAPPHAFLLSKDTTLPFLLPHHVAQIWLHGDSPQQT